MKTKRIAGAVLVAALIAFFRCTADKVAGNGTQTGNPTVAGVLYDANGARAVHATVRFYPVNYDPQTGSLGKIENSRRGNGHRLHHDRRFRQLQRNARLRQLQPSRLRRYHPGLP